MSRRPIPSPPPGSIDLTLWGPDDRCLLISGPLPLLGDLIRTIQAPAGPDAQSPMEAGSSESANDAVARPGNAA